MEIGYFTMPSHPPECGLKEGHDWDLQVIRWLDELGYQEVWIGEHHTAPWEPHPAPDLLLAQAFSRRPKHIRQAGRVPATVITTRRAGQPRGDARPPVRQSRLNFGVAASGLPSDWAKFGVEAKSGQNREMTRESLEMILRLRTAARRGPTRAEYWTVVRPDAMFEIFKPI